MVGFHNASSDRDTDETGDGCDSVRGGVVSSIFLCLAELADTNGGNGNSCSAGKTEKYRENDDTSSSMSRGQPYAEAGHDGEQNGEDADVERANDI